MLSGDAGLRGVRTLLCALGAPPRPSLSFPTVTEAVTAPASSHRWLLWVSNAMALCATQRRGFAGKVSGNRFELRPWPYLTCSK